MKKDEAKLGMKIKRVDAFEDLEEGTYTIKLFQGANAVGLEGILGVYLLKNFEPVNKFEIGDEVIYKSFDSQTIKTREEAVIFGIAPEKDKLKREYAISYIHEGPYREKKRVNKIVKECKLSPLKKKDQLQPGDKFKSMSTEYEVLAVAYEDLRDSIIYFAKMLNGNLEGRIVDFNSEFVDEIIYD